MPVGPRRECSALFGDVGVGLEFMTTLHECGTHQPFLDARRGKLDTSFKPVLLSVH